MLYVLTVGFNFFFCVCVICFVQEHVGFGGKMNWSELSGFSSLSVWDDKQQTDEKVCGLCLSSLVLNFNLFDMELCFGLVSLFVSECSKIR